MEEEVVMEIKKEKWEESGASEEIEIGIETLQEAEAVETWYPLFYAAGKMEDRWEEYPCRSIWIPPGW